MATIASVHSFRGGTGKSNITANLATLIAARGRRVGIVDTDISSPGVHVIFGLHKETIGFTLNDYLWGRCAIEEAAYPVSRVEGAVYVIPASLKTGAITRVLREGYDVGVLVDGFRDLIRSLSLDFLFIDTHPGLNDETLLSITISDVLLIILRPDEQDYLGTGVAVEVARRLDVPALHLIVNKVLDTYDFDEVRALVARTYDAPVAGVLPQSAAMMRLGSSGLFVLQYPDHPLSAALGQVADLLDAPRG